MWRALVAASRLRSRFSTTTASERDVQLPHGAGGAKAAARALLRRTNFSGARAMATQQQPAAARRPPPTPPGPEGCCQSGCKVCVWDTYREELRDYNRRLLEEDPGATPVAEAEQAVMAAAGMDAFEAMERQLQKQEEERRRQQQQQQDEKKP